MNPSEDEARTAIPEPVIVITGPTAGGKSSLARQLAERLGTGVFSLDSMKVYRGMSIGTAKPSPRATADVPFRMTDLREAWEAFSIGDYIDELAGFVHRVPSPWLLAGGTAFYLNALLHGIFRGPPPNPALRAELEAVEVSELHRRVSELDPASGLRIHATDRRRLTRALEVMAEFEEPFSVLQSRRVPYLRPGRFRLIGLVRPRADLYARIDARVESMFDRGWIEEVQALMDRHDPPWSVQANQSIGYPIIREALLEGRDPRAMLAEIQKRTRHFARHQLIWFRKMPIEWWRPDEADRLLQDIEDSLQRFAEHGAFPPAVPERVQDVEL
ncbi:MAG: tRNA (adenosine(37)-N6)-dimethylallyltransferase MiaA [Planctomycetes bacterium]|nr:tRNA (adenosine(37)-N6)-dimethylallyltransferase MiaA [Planctomycetota bacterium]